ncbi:hypothetical protein ACHAWF_003239, partial [Thalassiosira exigua]
MAMLQQQQEALPTSGLALTSATSSNQSSGPVPVPVQQSLGLSSTLCYSDLIDNTARSYSSVRLKCGVTIRLGDAVVQSCPGILEDLNHDLIACLSVLPASTRRLVRRTKIWVNRSYDLISKPTFAWTQLQLWASTQSKNFASYNCPSLFRMAFVVSISTINISFTRDNPEKEESIEIYNASEYQRMRLHYNGAGLLLHELCHIIHQKALPGGLANAMVVEIHKVAEESGKYSQVLRRDWALKDKDTDMAYCLINHKEFFAEISVAFLADFYHDVDGAGFAVMAKCSPPFVSPVVVERIQQQALGSDQALCTTKCRVMAQMDRMILPHCSKFFPFTKGQLRRYDPRVFKCFMKIWEFIEGWEDDEG